MDRVHRHDWLAGFLNGPASKRMKAGVAAPYDTRSREFNQQTGLLGYRRPRQPAWEYGKREQAKSPVWLHFYLLHALAYARNCSVIPHGRIRRPGESNFSIGLYRLLLCPTNSVLVRKNRALSVPISRKLPNHHTTSRRFSGPAPARVV